MNARLFTVASVVVNVALGALLVRGFMPAAHKAVAPLASVASARDKLVAPLPVLEVVPVPEKQPEAVVESFDWSGFFSADFCNVT